MKPRYKSPSEFQKADPKAYDAACRLGLLPELYKLAGIKKQTEKSNTNNFITKANIKHVNKYNYDKVEYINIDEKVIITCPQHGDFQQRASKHLRGQGCPKCGDKLCGLSKLLSNDKFIIKAKIKHNDKYTYDKVVYINGRIKVVITCPEHGDFEQIPVNHLSGKGCPKCKNKLTGLRFHSSTNEFIRKSKAKHGDKYNYDKVVYKTVNEKVIIICPEHGYFEQTASIHLSGQGCPKCGYKFAALKRRLTNDDFIVKANIKHVNKYNYDKVIYEFADKKVVIICPEHGDFEQKPRKHLEGQGCPKCANE